MIGPPKFHRIRLMRLASRRPQLLKVQCATGSDRYYGNGSIIIIIIIVVYYELSKRNWTIKGKNTDKIKNMNMRCHVAIQIFSRM